MRILDRNASRKGNDSILTVSLLTLFDSPLQFFFNRSLAIHTVY